jgi:hypothetical protein
MAAASQPAPPTARAARRRRLLVAALCLGSCLLVVRCLTVPTIRETPRWRYAEWHIKEVGGALRSYPDYYDQLPPATVCAPDGRPLYSWRVLLLPFLEQDRIYKEFHRDEPWDSPHNLKLLEAAGHVYVPVGGNGEDAWGLTRDQVFVGPGTAFERPGLTWKDFPDGLADTLLVVEAAQPVPWPQPADLAYDSMKSVPPLRGAFTKPRYSVWGAEAGRQAGFHAAFADGSVRFLDSGIDEATLRALITRNGGKTVDWDKVK